MIVSSATYTPSFGSQQPAVSHTGAPSPVEPGFKPLNFVYDDSARRLVVQFRDSSTGEVKRQYPTEQALATYTAQQAAAEQAEREARLAGKGLGIDLVEFSPPLAQQQADQVRAQIDATPIVFEKPPAQLASAASIAPAVPRAASVAEGAPTGGETSILA